MKTLQEITEDIICDQLSIGDPVASIWFGYLFFVEDPSPNSSTFYAEDKYNKMYKIPKAFLNGKIKILPLNKSTRISP